MRLVELRSLVALVGPEPAVLREFLSDFEQAAARAIGSIEADLGKRDRTALSDCAHRLKSSSHSVGAHRFGEAFSCLQDAARGDDWEAVRAAVQVLREQWPPLRAEIRYLLQSAAP